MKFNTFLKECHQKEVFKKLSLYVVTSWVIIQVFSAIWEPIGLPKESVTILLIILLIGFPINVYLVWRFDLLKQEQKILKVDLNGQEIPGKYVKSGFRKMYFSMLTLLSILFIVIVGVIIRNNFVPSVSFDSYDGSDKIVVEEFGNNTGDAKNDIIGKMAADWIIHGISENNAGQVISQKVMDDYSNIVISSVSPSRSKNLIREYFKPGKIISGNFYQKGDKFLFQGSLIYPGKEDEFISFGLIECDSESPLECIEQLKQLILGYLVTNENASNLETSPPKFDAYQHVITARANIKDNAIYIDEVEKAMAADPDYFEPKILEIIYYYNEEDYKKSDSLLKKIKPDSRTTKRQLNFLNMYKALLEGNNRKVHECLTLEEVNNPFDLENNQSLMVVALQFINRPELVDAIFEKIPSEEFIIENCLWCEHRIYVKAMADIQLKRYDTAIEWLSSTIEKVDGFYLNRPLASAYIRSNKLTELDRLVSDLELKANSEDLLDLYVFIGSEFLLLENKERAREAFNEVRGNENASSLALVAKSLLLLDDYESAEPIYRQLHEDHPEEPFYVAALAACLNRNQKIGEGEQMIKTIDSLRGDYQYGAVDYCFAQYYAITGQEENMFTHLLRSVSQGNYFTLTSFQNDPILRKYSDSEKFQAVLRYWD